MYLCTGTVGCLDSCPHYGESHYGPHFILHQWRATEALGSARHLKIAGALKHKVLPVHVIHCVYELFYRDTRFQ